MFDLAWIMYEVKRARECSSVCGALLFLNFLILALAGWLWLQHSQGNFAFFTVSSFLFFFKHPGCLIQKTWKWLPWLFCIWFRTKFTLTLWMFLDICLIWNVDSRVNDKIGFITSEVRSNVSGDLMNLCMKKKQNLTGKNPLIVHDRKMAPRWWIVCFGLGKDLSTVEWLIDSVYSLVVQLFLRVCPVIEHSDSDFLLIHFRFLECVETYSP